MTVTMEAKRMHRRITLMLCALVGMGSILMVGCSDQGDDIQVYRVTRDSDEALREAKRRGASQSPEEQGTSSMPAAPPVTEGASTMPTRDLQNQPMQAMPGMSEASDAIPNPEWQVPGHWQVLEPDAIRKGNFAVADDDGREAQITVTAFPGDVGGTVANVNRWRQQLGLPAQSDEQIRYALERIDHGQFEASYILIQAEDHGTEPNQTLAIYAAMIPWDGNTWFVRMTGDSELAEAEASTIREFVDSFQF